MEELHKIWWLNVIRSGNDRLHFVVADEDVMTTGEIIKKGTTMLRDLTTYSGLA
jgi:hypothetical protein